MVHHFPSLLIRTACFLLVVGAMSVSSPSSPDPQAVPPGDAASRDNADAQAALPLDELFLKARQATEREDFSTAESLYQSILVRAPENLSAILELSRVYEETGRLKYARGLLMRASMLNPYDKTIIERSAAIAKRLAESLREEAGSLIAEGYYELALPKLAMLLTIEPENADLYYKKALCHLSLRQPDMAVAAIDAALRIERKEAYYELRTEAEQLARAEEVRDLTRRAAGLLRTGSAEDRVEALELVQMILQIDPDNGWAKQTFAGLTHGEDHGTASGEENPQELDEGKSSWVSLRKAGEVILSVLRSTEGHVDLLIILLIVLIALRSPIALAILKGFPPRHLLSGKLSNISLPEVLSLLNANAQTGLLRVNAKSIKGDVYLENGEVYHCKSGKLEGTRALMALLKSAREGFFAYVKKPASIKRTIESPLSLLLMELPAKRSEGKTPPPLKKSKSKMKELLEKKSGN